MIWNDFLSAGYGCCGGSSSFTDYEQVSDEAKRYKAKATEEGHIILDEDIVKVLGIEDAAELHVVNEGNRIEIYPNIHSLGKIYIEPTSKCNLSCHTCVRRTWKEPMGNMDLHLFDALIEQLKDFKSLHSVMFGGFGEPTFHKDILYMIAKIKSLGVNVEMVTNGTLLDETLLKGLIENGLDTLWVSFDGTSADRFEDIREGANFNAIVKNLKNLKSLNLESAHKVKVGIAFVVMKNNINELKNMDKLIYQIDASKVSISNVFPYSIDMLDEMVCSLNVGDIAPNTFNLKSAFISLPIIDITEATKEPLYELFMKNRNVSIMRNKIGTETSSCRFIKERCTFIRWDGNVAPCMGLLHSYSTYFNYYKTEREVTPYSFGDISKNNLKDIWNSQEYHDFRERVDSFDFSPCFQCGPCQLAEKNLEDCFGNEFPTCGGCLWGQGVIQCP
ncbi:radical SAM protein [Clostridium bovifaecis]|uniref:Radical SAM protein n=1 Tax=Clostridium bovifaecis TaxID=2184719 RepID=A0A6I6EPI3_9CLOT|nr:radical SAM protein [Clostridium bovifaecis]